MVDLRNFTPTRHRTRRSTNQPAPSSPDATPAAKSQSQPQSPAPVAGAEAMAPTSSSPGGEQQHQQQRRVPVGSRHGSFGGGFGAAAASWMNAPPPRAAPSNTGRSGSPAPVSAVLDDAAPDGASPSSASVANGNPPRTDDVALSGSTLGNATYPPPVRDRDEHIASLHRELAAMEAEFQRELDRLAQTESEAVSYWQAKHNALRVEARSLDEEVRALRAQVRGLKEWVSTSTRAECQTSDEVLAASLDRLANVLQNWVIVNFRRARLDLSKATPDVLQQLERLAPNYEELVSSSKLHLLQSVVLGMLEDVVFGAYFVGLDEQQTRQLRDMEALIYSTTSSQESVNRWRAATLNVLWRDERQIHIQEGIDRAIDNAVALINHMLDSITAPAVSSMIIPNNGNSAALLSTPAANPDMATAPSAATLSPIPSPHAATASPPSRDVQVLRALVANAVDIAHQLKAQRAMFRTHMPRGADFDPTTMEDIGGEEDDALAQKRTVRCVVFPAVIKNGDERGAQLHLENVIVKARVLCSSSEE